MFVAVNFGSSLFEIFFGILKVAKKERRWRIRLVEFARVVLVGELKIFI